MLSRLHGSGIALKPRPIAPRHDHARSLASRRTGPACACGGTCPRCQHDSVGSLAGTREQDLAPPSSKPDPLTEKFGRWVGYTTQGSIQFNPKVDPQPPDKPFFRWNANFQTSMELGTIVQLIESTWWAENCDGTAFTGADGNATYWESWHVENGQVQGGDKTYGAHDRWERNVCDVTSFGSSLCPTYPQATRGVWAMAGTLYAYPGIDLGWIPGGHPMSGSRPSTSVPPTQDLGRPMARREIGGAWDSCDPASPKHDRL